MHGQLCRGLTVYTLSRHVKERCTIGHFSSIHVDYLLEGRKSYAIKNLVAQILPEPRKESDQVHEPEKTCIAERVLGVYKGMEESPTHNLAAVDVTDMAYRNYAEDLMEVFERLNYLFLLPPLVPSSIFLSLSWFRPAP